MNIRLFSVIIAGMLSVVGLSDRSIAKPGENNTNVGNGVIFTFQGCTYFPKQEKVVCLGNFRSSSGEHRLFVYRNSTTITNIQGKTYESSEVAVGTDFICKQNCNSTDPTFVEGVDYKSIFVFDGVSLPSSKIPLLSINVINTSNYLLKYRNIKVKINGNNESNDRSDSSDVDRSSPTNSLTESPQPKAIDRPSTPQPTVNNEPRPKSPVTGIVENLVIRGLNDLFRIPNK
jgi:hypothetical protein